MNHNDVRGYCVAVPLLWWFALCTVSTEFPVIRTKPEDTRILHFLVMRKTEKRVAIVAQQISEEKERRERNTVR